MTTHTCDTCAYCGYDTDTVICHKHLNDDLTPCGSWEPRGFDYEKMAREAKQEGDFLRKQLDKLRAVRPKTADEQLRLQKRIEMLDTMRIEQDSNFRFFSERARERRLG